MSKILIPPFSLESGNTGTIVNSGKLGSRSDGATPISNGRA
ncbi:hypothetical protein [Rickettsia endosymbiont of Oedothorax gibbosus]|nr:hypothetical protein [Rickettsia endosymbiont of Oedothorax gibbosus]